MCWQKIWNKLVEPKPINCGYLPVADGHEVYFMEYGNKYGKPIFLTHGGPGGACKAKHAACFDLKKYRVIMMDQRGCGKSLPLGCLKNNTMEDLIWDIKRLYDFLQIKEKIILRGGSWGSTVMLCFAERYPELVDKMILTQIFLADEENDKWFNEQSALFYPDFMEDMRKGVASWKSLPEYYEGLLNSDDKNKQLKAVNMYGWYERVLGNLNPSWGTTEELREQEFSDMRIYLNYASRAYTLKSNQIMRNVKKIAHIPTLIVHNRLDMVCPLKGAYDLSKKMKNVKLVIVPEKGHIGDLLYKTIKKEVKKFL